jgi:hypothetical protein
MRIATIQQHAVFTEYLTLLSFESFHIGLVREMFTPLQSTVNEATRTRVKNVSQSERLFTFCVRSQSECVKFRETFIM